MRIFCTPEGRRAGLGVTLMLALAGCTGGDDATGEGDPGADANILTYGSIQRFGSVFVNDTEYFRSDRATVITDDNPNAGEDSLRIGMRVALRGRRNDDGTGRYDSIEVDNELKGPIETGSIDTAGTPDTLRVLGTTVIVSDTTIFDESGPGNSVNGLADLDDSAGNEDVIEVSGLFTADGSLRALRIEKKAEDLATYLGAGRKLEIKGNVASVDTAASRLRLESGQVVDYANARVDDDMPADPATWVGMFVEAKCEPDDPGFAANANACFDAGVLLATKIDNEVPNPAGGSGAELEGFIANFVSLASFRVSGIAVDASAARLDCPAGVTPGNGLKVKVRGRIENNVLTAAVLECRAARTVRLEGIVQAASGSSVTLLGIDVTADQDTEFDDVASLGALGVGDALEVRGFADGVGGVIAVRVKLEDDIDADDFVVQAPLARVGNVADPRFDLLGVVVDTSALDNDDFEGSGGAGMGRAVFFQTLAAGGGALAVKAKGTYDAGTHTLRAREVEFEDAD